MSKMPFKLPNVFVGCPYGRPFDFDGFRSALNHIPMRFHYADTHLATKHLLSILRTYIQAVDFCLFDVSTWNPNVALELGIADGVGADYYILLNRKQAKGVPADLQGLQRIEYTDFDDLTAQIHKYLLKDETYPRRIFENLSGDHAERNNKFRLAMRVLAHFRDNRRMTNSDLRRLARGTWLRDERQDEIVTILEEQQIIKGYWKKAGASLKKNLYKEEIRVRR